MVLLSVNLHQGRPLICILVYIGWCRERRVNSGEGIILSFRYPSSSLRPNPSLHRTPKRIPLSVVFIPALLHLLSVTICSQLSSSWKGCRPSYPSWGYGEGVGVFFHPFSLTWLYSGSVYPSVTPPLSCKPNLSSSLFICSSLFLFCLSGSSVCVLSFSLWGLVQLLFSMRGL